MSIASLHLALVLPGYAAEREEPGLAAILDLVERVAEVHRVTVVALHHPAAGPPYRLAGARVVPLGLPGGGGAAGRARTLARGVAELVRQHRRAPFDVIHALWADEPGATAVLAAALTRTPSVVSVLGGELVGLPDIGYGAALGRGGRWTARLALRRARAVTVGSSSLAGQVRIVAPQVAPDLCPLGVDTALFAPAQDRIGPAAAQTVLFVGSLEPVKDPAAAVRIFAAVAAVRPLARLVVAGDGSLRPEVERLAATLGVTSRVELLGHVPRVRMPEVYRSAAALLVTSRHEGQHVAAIEAAACGVPVAGFAVGALPDIGAGAAVVPRGDEAALQSALARLIDDPAAALRAGDEARTAATARYDVRVATGRFLELYGRLAPRAWPDSVE